MHLVSLRKTGVTLVDNQQHTPPLQLITGFSVWFWWIKWKLFAKFSVEVFNPAVPAF
jgi:hypothetical protein